ncbi:MAG: AAA family ATPase [Candidatus Moranbacteria bacterium]|nr:AAA family ATPase [Candidatus Moranbacteria bacterium]
MESFKRLAEEKERKRLEKIREKLKLISWKDLSQEEYGACEWIVDRVVPMEGVTIMSGAPASYKTWLLLQLASDIVQGTSFLGQFRCEKKRVLIVDEENHARLLQKRLHSLGTPTDVEIHLMSQKNFLVTDEAMRAVLLEHCEKTKSEVIIFDSLIRISHADENDARSMDDVFRGLKALCGAHKTVIVTHHERKEGLQQRSSAQNRMRGSSNISAQIDSHVAISRDKFDRRLITVEHAKSREEEELPSFKVAVRSENDRVWFEYLGEHDEGKTKKETAAEVIPLILQDNPGGFTKTEITTKVLELVDVGGKNAQKALDELITKGVVGTRKGKGNTQVCLLLSSEDEVSDHPEMVI